jgi:hypothetical protein
VRNLCCKRVQKQAKRKENLVRMRIRLSGLTLASSTSIICGENFYFDELKDEKKIFYSFNGDTKVE